MLMVSCSQATVLCKGEDGRVVIEGVGINCYNIFSVSVSPGASVVSAERVLSSNKGNCAPCVDIPICVRLTGVFKEFNQVNPILLVSTTIVPTTIASFDFSEYQLGSELFATVNISLASLRTIILLI